MWGIVFEQNDELYEEKKLFLEEAGLPSTKAFPLYNDRCVYVCVNRAIASHHTNFVYSSCLSLFSFSVLFFKLHTRMICTWKCHSVPEYMFFFFDAVIFFRPPYHTTSNTTVVVAVSPGAKPLSRMKIASWVKISGRGKKSRNDARL